MLMAAGCGGKLYLGINSATTKTRVSIRRYF
jgi:hypothetical protein